MTTTVRHAGAASAWRLGGPRTTIPALVAVCVIVVLLPFLGLNGYLSRTVMLIGILSLLTSGLNVVLGYAGELAVNQVFLYGLGAYVAAYLGVSLKITDVLLVYVLLVAASVVIGIAAGVPGLRLGGWSLAIVSFLMVIVLPDLITLFGGITGGQLGLSTVPPTIFGVVIKGRGLYVLIMLTVIIWFAVVRNLILSAHGNAFLVMRESPVLAASLGISVFRLKLLVYVIGAVPCALAGALFAWLDGFIAPDTFTFAMALSVLAASMFGGSTSIYGAILGAFVLQYGQQELAGFDTWELVIYGVFLLVAALVLRNGIVGLVRRLAARIRRGSRESAHTRGSAKSPDGLSTVSALDLRLPAGELLECSALTKHFGGNTALHGVSITARPGLITSLIGPNGSGKTTLLNLICGFYVPSGGRILVGGERISGLKPYRIARAGIARTFQTPLVAAGMTTRDFVAAGRYTSEAASMASSILRLRSYRSSVAADRAEALRLLEAVGILDVAATEVSELPLGTRRLAEVARALAAKPRIFLFDEVASGLDQADLVRLERTILAIRQAGATVILVEHNFGLVLKVSDTIHVLSQGSLIATGTPAEIRANEQVLAEYAGGSASARRAAAGPHTGEPAERGA